MNYVQECLELDKKLAELLGWTDVSESCTYGKPVDSDKILSSPITRWTQDDAKAFRLVAEYEIDIRTMSIGVECQDADCNKSYVVVLWGSFPNKLAAVRFAIVQAVVNKLQGEK